MNQEKTETQEQETVRELADAMAELSSALRSGATLSAVRPALCELTAGLQQLIDSVE